MENKIKLRPKQLSALAQLGMQKQQLEASFKEISRQESLLVELILEEGGVTEPVGDVSIDGDTLSYKPIEKTAKPKGKQKKLEPVKA